jgi:predicted RNA binding protein YcfA (HicA-like mRNA interferase family)
LVKKLSAGSLKNVAFSDMINLVQAFGFRLSRVSGSHHIFMHPEIPELINLQGVKGEAKPYQVRQVLRLVEKYNLKMEESE